MLRTGESHLLPRLALVLAGLLLLAGLFLAGTYVYSAVIERLGEADQSLLFWYLPVLFIGLGLTAAGFCLGSWGYQRLKVKR